MTLNSFIHPNPAIISRDDSSLIEITDIGAVEY